jgi:hypothetical protein
MSPPLSPVRGVAGIVALAASVFILVIPGLGHTEPLPIRIDDYNVPEGCPDKTSLLVEIAKRTPVARVASQFEIALAVQASISKYGRLNLGRLNQGHLVLRRENRLEPEVVRAFEADTCEDVVSAFAFVIALTIDPHASVDPTLPPRIPIPPRPRLPTSSTRSEAQRSPEVLVLSPQAPDFLALPTPVVFPDMAQVAGPGGYFGWRVGPRTSVALGATPSALWGAGIVVERRLGSPWEVSLRVSLELAATGTYPASVGAAEFVRGMVRAEGCAFTARLSRPLTLSPCLGAEGGVLLGEGIAGGSLTNAQLVPVPWFGLSLLPRIVLNLGAVFAEAQGGPVFPLVRGKFVAMVKKGDDQLIQPIFPVTWTLSVGGGLQF